MRCPGCQIELLKLQVKIDEVVRDVWAHPNNPLKKCDYSQDGLSVTVEVLDQFLMGKFQELVKEEGTVSPLPVPLEVAKPQPLCNMDKIKNRLADGLLSVSEFDEVKRRIE